MTIPYGVLQETMALDPPQKAELIDRLLATFDEPDMEIDKLWAIEAENRLDAYKAGKLKAVSLDKVLEKYK